jgi:hypothetical protein
VSNTKERGTIYLVTMNNIFMKIYVELKFRSNNMQPFFLNLTRKSILSDSITDISIKYVRIKGKVCLQQTGQL